jgi:hypothetical protein
MTFCDATDRGILLVVVLLILWIVVLFLLRHDVALRRKVMISGIVLFVIRVGARPVSEYCWRRRQKRQQSSLVQEIPQHSPMGSPTSRSPWSAGTPDSSTKMLRNSSSDSPYLDRRMNGSENGGGGAAGGGALELHSMGNNGAANGRNDDDDDDPIPGIQYSNSTGSDPMIAAI